MLGMEWNRAQIEAEEIVVWVGNSETVIKVEGARVKKE